MIEKVLIIDFGSQYTQLIARRVREQNVYCEIQPYHNAIHLSADLKGIILSGSPSSVYAPDAPSIDLASILGRVPVLGVCYGAQLISHDYNGKVESAGTREYGRAHLSARAASPLLTGVTEGTQVWMSHGDTVTKLPDGYELIASTESVENAAFQNLAQKAYAIQFHPEVTHSTEGATILRNFLYNICG
ncbi:MAG TPA: glutamine-hydrolyzing GMP synthase, partial [Bacteroidia bacterium]|nr:glutamine-hydrolyzing GMP synthase [Bacteroidia bacterium]